MGLFNIYGGKKDVPNELPKLITDEIEDESLNKTQEGSAKIAEMPSGNTNVLVSSPAQNQKSSQDISFFNELETNINKEIGDLTNLERWYKNKFLPGDVVSDMRTYWKNQKPASVLSMLGDNFQSKISGMISELQKLEKDWQDTYFVLNEKENEIKILERELKKMLKEFIEVCRSEKSRRKKNG